MSTNKQSFDDLYIKIIDQFPNPIWRSGLDTKCDFFNKSWLTFTGRTMDQEMGNGWVEGVFKEDLDACVKTYLDAFKAHEPFSMKYRLKYNDGTYHWLLDAGAPFFDDDNKFLGYIGSCYDINEEEERLISKNIESIVLQAIHDGIWDWDVSSGNASFSKTFYEILGFDNNEFVANYSNWLALVSPEDKERVERELVESTKSANSFDIELRIKNKKGDWFWALTRGKVIENNPDGSAKRMIGTFSDISKRKQIETELSNTQENYKQKLKEAEKLNALTVERELKMIELKKRIKELEAK
ncbi:MAG: PAS domain-containing protein [bacterium]